MDRAEKQAELETIAQSLRSAQVALCADYRGLTVAQITGLRKSLRESGSFGKVIKNTLGKISVRSVFGADAPAAELDKFLSLFEGPTMLVVNPSDPVSPAKALTAFMGGKSKLQIKGAWLEGRFLDNSAVTDLSKMPGREEILGQLLRLINTPATQLVRLMKEPSRQVAQVLGAHCSALERAQEEK